MRTKLSIGRTSAFACGAIVALMGFAPTASMAQGGIQVILNGSSLNFDQAEPVKINDRVLVPMRRVFEALGARVDYDPDTQKIRAGRGDTHIRLQIGSVQAFVNDRESDLDVPAQVTNGSTMVPLRFVSEAMGANVRWDEFHSTVFIDLHGAHEWHAGGGPVNDAPPAPAPYWVEGAPIDTFGVILNLDFGHNRFLVHTDRGDRWVQSANVRDFHRGDSVHVAGAFHGGSVHARIVEHH